MRRWLPNAAATEDGKELSSTELDQLFRWYRDEIDWQPHQQNLKPSERKSVTQTKMRREAGSTFVANCIWTIGMPRLPPFATEQRLPKTEEIQTVPQAIQNVLEWLDRIASARLSHLQTAEYKEAVRKAGTTHGQSGLSAEEYQIRAAIRKAKHDLRTARELEKEMKNGRLTAKGNKRHWQQKLLEAYANGDLLKRIQEATSGGSRDTLCRRPSLGTVSAYQ